MWTECLWSQQYSLTQVEGKRFFTYARTRQVENEAAGSGPTYWESPRALLWAPPPDEGQKKSPRGWPTPPPSVGVPFRNSTVVPKLAG